MVDRWVGKGLVLPMWTVGHVVGLSETLHMSKSELPGLRNVQTDDFLSQNEFIPKTFKPGSRSRPMCLIYERPNICPIYTFEKQEAQGY